jgi:hypothetical protein
MPIKKEKYFSLNSFQDKLNAVIVQVNAELDTNIKKEQYFSLTHVVKKLNEVIDVLNDNIDTPIKKERTFGFIYIHEKLNEIIAVVNTGLVVEPDPTTLRVRFGGATIVLNSLSFVSDQPYLTAGARSTFTDATAVANTVYDALYQTEVYDADTWTFPVNNGNYTIYLHFNETFVTTAFARRFHVDVNSVRLLNDFDIWTLAGGRFIALVRSFNITVSTGAIVLQTVTGLANSPKINGLEIVAQGQPSGIPLG